MSGEAPRGAVKLSDDERDAFLARVRVRQLHGPYVVDWGGGFGGCTVVTGPTLRAGYILQSADDRRPEAEALKLNGAWAAGYEQAAGEVERLKAEQNEGYHAAAAQAERARALREQNRALREALEQGAGMCDEIAEKLRGKLAWTLVETVAAFLRQRAALGGSE